MNRNYEITVTKYLRKKGICSQKSVQHIKEYLLFITRNKHKSPQVSMNVNRDLKSMN